MSTPVRLITDSIIFCDQFNFSRNDVSVVGTKRLISFAAHLNIQTNPTIEWYDKCLIPRPARSRSLPTCPGPRSCPRQSRTRESARRTSLCRRAAASSLCRRPSAVGGSVGSSLLSLCHRSPSRETTRKNR